jgi:hypothetical protein
MTAFNETARELTTEELGEVTGAWTFPYYAAVHQFVHPLDLVSLNPQPLPPRALSFFRG